MIRILEIQRSTMKKDAAENKILAGLAGFEPAHDGIKTRCLTAWLQPN